MFEGPDALTLTTPRLRLIAATAAMISAELDDRDRLAALLDVVVPPDWPPEHHDADTLRFWRERISDAGPTGWWLYYAVATHDPSPTLVGSVGYKGRPVDGTVELGYSVVPSWQQQGLATEASRGLIAAAWERGAEVVVAHTFEHLDASIAVLRKLGFQRLARTGQGELEFRLRRA